MNRNLVGTEHSNSSTEQTDVSTTKVSCQLQNFQYQSGSCVYCSVSLYDINCVKPSLTCAKNCCPAL